LTVEEVPAENLSNWKEDLWIIASKGYTPLYIVDGQQRLTTAIILIQCIIDTLAEGQKLNYTSAQEIKKRFIYDSKDEGISRSYIFGYEKDNPSYEFLKTNIFLENSDNSLSGQETIYTHNLGFAKRYFSDKLHSMSFQDIEMIYRKLTQHLLFNIYSISDDVDVFMAFETMNNRGKPLSHLELLKNRLIYLSTKFDTDEFEKSKLRHLINETWKTVYHYLGKNKANPLDDDVFLYNHFILYYGEELRNHLQYARLIPYDMPKSLFYRAGPRQYYKDFILDNVFTAKNINKSVEDAASRELTIKEIYSYAHNLKASVEIWYQLLNPRDSGFSDEEKIWLEKLNRMEILRVAPLLMVFYQAARDSKTRLRFVKALERHLFVQMLIGNYRYDEDFGPIDFGDISIQLIKDKTNTERAIKETEQHIEELLGKNSFRLRLVDELKSRNHYTWRGIRYFLFEYELELKMKSRAYRDRIDAGLYFSERREDYQTVEHIYPQKPGRKPCWTEKFQLYSDREKAVLRNSFGNLVPLSKPKNSSLQNKCFEEKKGTKDDQVSFRYGSYSEMEVADSADWTATEILNRGIKLLDFLEQRWKLRLGTKQEKVSALNLDFVLRKENTTIS